MDTRKCPSCGAEMELSLSNKCMICPFCDTHIDVEITDEGNTGLLDEKMFDFLWQLDSLKQYENVVTNIDSMRYCLNDLKSAESVADYIKTGRLKLSSTFTILKEAEAVIICLPTPLTKQHTPDLSYIESSVKSIAENASKGVLVMLESTTYPGTTVEVMLPVLEKAFGKVGVDFYLGYSPEREDPGNPLSNFDNVPKVISGVTEECKKKAIALY